MGGGIIVRRFIGRIQHCSCSWSVIESFQQYVCRTRDTHRLVYVDDIGMVVYMAMSIDGVKWKYEGIHRKKYHMTTIMTS